MKWKKNRSKKRAVSPKVCLVVIYPAGTRMNYLEKVQNKKDNEIKKNETRKYMTNEIEMEEEEITDNRL